MSMGVGIFISCVCFFNIVMWIILMFRFKKLFNKDNELKIYAMEVEQIKKSLNAVTQRDVNVFEAKQQELKKLIAEIDRKVDYIRAEESKLIMLNQFTNGAEKNPSSKSKNKSKNTTITSKYESNSSSNVVISDILSSEPNMHVVDENQDEVKGVKIPVFVPKVYMADKMIEPVKSLNEQIYDLYKKGMEKEEIASMLSLSAQEVALALEFVK